MRSLPLLRYLRSLSIPSVRIPVPSLSMRGLRIVAITTTMTFVFATAIGTTGFIAQQGTIALGASTTITIISGEVSVRASDAEGFRPVVDGALLRAGMTIQTGPDTYAVLTYFEGSTVSIDPSTTLVIAALEANPDGSTVISMHQEIGRTWHSVSKLLHQGSKYEVRTPTATATVRGTTFAVGVESNEQGELVSTVETTEGAVGTSKAPTAAEPQPKEEVIVQPGFQVSVKTAAPLEAPRPQPEPERKVTVTVGATAGLVVDPLGRSNGIKDGKVVVQTPGAKVETVDGKVVITLPKIPDGKISTVVDPKVSQRDEVEVVTTVNERGRSEHRTETRVEASTAATPAVTAVEVKKGANVRVANVTTEEKKDIASSVKVAEAPKKEERKGKDSKDKGKDEKREGQGGPGGPAGPGGGAGGPGAPGFAPAGTVPPLPLGDQTGAQLIGRRPEPAKDKEQAKDAGRPEQAKDAGRQEGNSGQAQQQRQEAPKVEAPRFELPKIELPRIEPPKADAPKNEGQRQEAPRQEGPKQEAPKQEGQSQEAPKQDAQKDKEKSQAPVSEVSGFVPTLVLPSVPFAGEPSKKDSPKEKSPEAPKIELPKIELPFFQPQRDQNKEKDRVDRRADPPKREVERDNDRGRGDGSRDNERGRDNDRSHGGRSGGRGEGR